MEEELDGYEIGDDLRVVGLFPLLYMKLTAWRPKDQGHVIGLLNSGAVDVGGLRAWLKAEARDAERMEARLDRMLEQAEGE